MKISPVEAEIFHANVQMDRWTDGQTNVTDLILACRKIANTLKNEQVNPVH
jgi:hypothetical protein